MNAKHIPSGIFNLAQIDTTPGAGGLFSPPAGFSGDSDDYLDFLRARYLDQRFSQLFWVQKRYLEKGMNLAFSGPFSEQAKKALAKISGN